MDQAKALFFSYKQDQNESNDKHLRNFKSIVETDNIRYVKRSMLRRAEGLAVYYPMGLSAPNGRSTRYWST